MADELRTVVGFDAESAISALTAMEVKLQSWTAAMEAASNTTRRFNSSAASTVPSMNSFSTASAAVTKSTYDVDRGLKGLPQQFEKVNESAASMILTWQSVIRIFAIQVIHQAISNLISSFNDAAAAGMQFEKSLAEIQTVSREFAQDFEGLAQKVEEFSAATGQPIPAVTEGLYEALSNQVTDAAHSFEFMQAAADFSNTTITDLNSSVNLLSSVINSYGMSAEDAADAGGKLFKVIELGRVRGQEMADTFGRVAVLSAQLGISLDELGASIAALTISGLKYNEAFTLIVNVETKLLKPTEDLKKTFADLGVATAEAGIQAYGFQGFLQQITNASGETASEIGKLFKNVRAIRGALGLAAQAKFYTDSLKEIRDASRETLKEAKELTFKTNAKQLEIELNKASVAMTRFGRTLTSLSLGTLNIFGGATSALVALTAAVTSGIAVYATLKLGIIGIVGSLLTFKITVASLTAAWASFLAMSPVGWALLAAGAVAAAVVAYNRLANSVERAREAMVEAAKKQAASEKTILENQLRIQEEVINKQLSAVQKYLIQRNKLFTQVTKTIEELEGLQFSSLSNQLKDSQGAVNNFFDALISKSRDASKTIREINQTISGLKDSMKDFGFERSLKSLNTYQEIFARIAQSEKLRSEASIKASQKDFESADSLNQRAEAQAKAALSAADQSNNASLIRRAEDEVNRVLQSQITTQEKLRTQTIRQKNAVDSVIVSMELQRNWLDFLITKAKEYEEALKKAKFPSPDRAKIEADLKNVAASIDKTFADMAGKLDLAKQIGLKDEFTDVSNEFKQATTGIFDPVTGQLGTFETAINSSLNRVNTQFNTFAQNTKTAMQDVADSLVGVGTPIEQQERIVELGKQYKQAAQSTKDYSEAQSNLRIILRESSFLEQQLGTAIRTTIANESEGTEATRQFAIANQSLIQPISTAFNLLSQGKGNTEEFGNALKQVTSEMSRLSGIQQEKGFFQNLLTPDIATPLQQIVEKLNEGAVAAKTMGENAEQMKLGEALQATLSQFNGAINQWSANAQTASLEAQTAIGPGIANAASTGANGVASASTSMISSLQAVQQQAIATSQAVSSATVNTVAKALGGRIYFASGGLAKGTDTVPAMLSRGEFVSDANTTRKFFSQLIAMKAGINPVFKQNGGEVTNIGDINVQVSGNDSMRQTAFDFARTLRREIRRKTTRLN